MVWCGDVFVFVVGLVCCVVFCVFVLCGACFLLCVWKEGGGVVWCGDVFVSSFSNSTICHHNTPHIITHDTHTHTLHTVTHNITSLTTTTPRALKPKSTVK